MHILIVHQVFITPKEGGGTRHYEFAKFLVKQGYRVTVLASQVDYATGKLRSCEFETLEGINIHYVPALKGVNKSIFFRALSFLYFAIRSYRVGIQVQDVDLLWATSPPLFQVYTAYRIAKRKRVKWLFEVRDLWLDFAKQLGVVKNPAILFVFKQLEKRMYKKADFLMVNSPGFLPHLRRVTQKPVI
ncbi:MAG: hypothetical protein ACI9BD_001029, partial [Candidatus Marinamargulisbacteria bacterium]